MRCPYCQNADTNVTETRQAEGGQALKRRRVCGGCGKRFSTLERADQDFPQVVKRDGGRQNYQREKLRASVDVALRKRPVPATKVDALLDTVELMMRQAGEREISSQAIGEAVMGRLRELDQVAYLRFASVYHNYADLVEFAKAIHAV